VDQLGRDVGDVRVLGTHLVERSKSSTVAADTSNFTKGFFKGGSKGDRAVLWRSRKVSRKPWFPNPSGFGILICCMVIIYPEVPFAFHGQRHPSMLRKCSVHLVR